MTTSTARPGTNKLDPEVLLARAASCVAVMRDVAAKNQKIRFHGIGRAVGLIGQDEPWEAWHRQQVADICQFAAAADVHAYGRETLEWWRVVDRQGNPLKGVTRNSRLFLSLPTVKPALSFNDECPAQAALEALWPSRLGIVATAGID